MIMEIILCAVIVMQSILHYIERERLQDRIMSRNLTEFKAKDESPKTHKSAHDRVLRKWRGRE